MSPTRHLTECASTNDVARAWARDTHDPAPEGAIVTADYQTAGRGRRGRVWRSEPGENALMSIVLRPPYAIDEAWKLGFVAAVAVADALADFGVSPHLKWPNDILVEARKAGGILVETETAAGGGWAAVVGVGVNVNQPSFDDGPYDLSPISLRMATGDELPVAEIIDSVRGRLLTWEDTHRRLGFASIVQAWRERMAVGYEIKRGASRGVQSLLQDDGKLRVMLPDGTFAVWGTIDE